MPLLRQKGFVIKDSPKIVFIQNITVENVKKLVGIHNMIDIKNHNKKLNINTTSFECKVVTIKNMKYNRNYPNKLSFTWTTYSQEVKYNPTRDQYEFIEDTVQCLE